MKSNVRRTLLAALAIVGAGAMVSADAQSTSSAPAPGAAHAGRHFRGHFRAGPQGRFVGSLLRGVNALGGSNPQLALTATQKESIRSILKGARPSGAPAATTQFDLTVVGNPAHKDYASAVQGEKDALTARIEKETSIASQIYGVLTPAQQQALPQALAAIEAKQQARRAAWQQRHAAGAAG